MTLGDTRLEAQRPALTPVFICAMSLWASSAMAYSSCRLAQDWCASGIALSVFSAAICLVFAVVLKQRQWPLVFASVCIGALIGFAQAHAVWSASMQVQQLESAEAVIALQEDSSDKGKGEQALATVRIPDTADFLATVNFGDEVPRYYGQRYQCKVRLRATDFKDDAFSWSRGSCGTCYADNAEEEKRFWLAEQFSSFRQSAIESIGAEDDAHAILQALACGYRHNISGTAVYTDFQSCGLAHLIAVSGAHLVIVTSLFASALNALRVPRRISVVILVGLMCSYLVLSGFPVSAIRATFMSSIGIFSLFARRRPSSLNALGIGAITMIGFNPLCSVSVSFALSALSTLGIVILAPLVQSWFEKTPLKRMPGTASALALTISSSAASQLYASSIFMSLPLVSPLANVVCTPLFPITCSLGLVSGIAGAVGLPGSDVLGLAASVLSGLLEWLVSFMAELPYASVPFWISTIEALAISAAIVLSLWAFWPSGKRVCIAAVVIAIACFTFLGLSPSSDELVMFDVGQGDSILMRSQGKTLLVDTGNHDSLLKQELARNRITHLDAVMITHADDDHFGSLDVLADMVDVGQVILAEGMSESSAEKPRKLLEASMNASDNLVEVSKGDQITIGAFKATVIWPDHLQEDGGNADSICLRIEYDGDQDGLADHTALLTGDAEKDELAELIGRHDLEQIEVLKVGHHGSRNGMTEDELDVLKPTIALIGVGKNNRYGHPTQEILDMLDGISCRTYRTDEDGEIRCLFSIEDVRVSCSIM